MYIIALVLIEWRVWLKMKHASLMKTTPIWNLAELLVADIQDLYITNVVNLFFINWKNNDKLLLAQALQGLSSDANLQLIRWNCKEKYTQQIYKMPFYFSSRWTFTTLTADLTEIKLQKPSNYNRNSCPYASLGHIFLQCFENMKYA